MVSSVTFDRFEQAHMHANRVKSCGQCHSKKKITQFSVFHSTGSYIEAVSHSHKCDGLC